MEETQNERGKNNIKPMQQNYDGSNKARKKFRWFQTSLKFYLTRYEGETTQTQFVEENEQQKQEHD
jgi:hypothetical protein